MLALDVTSSRDNGEWRHVFGDDSACSDDRVVTNSDPGQDSLPRVTALSLKWPCPRTVDTS